MKKSHMQKNRRKCGTLKNFALHNSIKQAVVTLFCITINFCYKWREKHYPDRKTYNYRQGAVQV